MLLSTSTGSPENQEPPAAQSAPITVASEDRWQVYHRLKSLDIDCQCSGFQPLTVQVKTPTEMLQLWSVLRQVSQPRLVLAAGLQRCWQASY
ncbi:MAG: Asr1405/Asl0597 family protein [Phormidesmis sp.]